MKITIALICQFAFGTPLPKCDRDHREARACRDGVAVICGPTGWVRLDGAKCKRASNGNMQVCTDQLH